jgi:hypothetical protein
VVAEPTVRGKRETTQNRTEEVKAKTGGTEKMVKVDSMIRGTLNA